MVGGGFHWLKDNLDPNNGTLYMYSRLINQVLKSGHLDF